MDPNHIYRHEQQDTTFGTFVATWRLKHYHLVDATPGKSCRSKWYHLVEGRPYLDTIMLLFPGGEDAEHQNLTSLYVLCRNTRKNLFAKMSISYCRSDGLVISARHHDWTVYNCKKRYAGPQGISRDMILQNIAGDNVLIIKTEVTYTHSNIKVAGIEKRFSILSPAAIHIDVYDRMLKATGKDIVIRSGGQDFNVHKSVLIAWSSVFAEKLLHDPTGVIEENDFGPNVVRSLVDFLYHGRLVHIDLTLAANLILIGHKYHIAGLKNYCFRFLATVSPGTCEDNVEKVEQTLFKLPLSPELILELSKCLRDDVY